MGDVPFPNKGLEVGPELHAVGRVHIDHLHVPAEPFIVQQRVHDHERIAEDHPVYPLVGVFIRFQHLVGDGMPGVAIQVIQIQLLVGLVPHQRFNDGFSGEPLVDKQRQGRHVKRQPFRFACPVQEGLAQGFKPVQRLFGLTQGLGNFTLTPALTLPSPRGRG